ncbi:hypothetical protein BV898_04590 [Hypsibius exemplaris]|uniref:Uncharacterized protein n=1 Tax=Hypsibius exemplaris TaxID=2072580 RepID=A0A1W0X1T4_HYPEX|nr:hypothetical protein BV898_04590 [Hypsibius exemplaris]
MTGQQYSPLITTLPSFSVAKRFFSMLSPPERLRPMSPARFVAKYSAYLKPATTTTQPTPVVVRDLNNRPTTPAISGGISAHVHAVGSRSSQMQDGLRFYHYRISKLRPKSHTGVTCSNKKTSLARKTTVAEAASPRIKSWITSLWYPAVAQWRTG